MQKNDYSSLKKYSFKTIGIAHEWTMYANNFVIVWMKTNCHPTWGQLVSNQKKIRTALEWGDVVLNNKVMDQLDRT